MLEQSLNHLRSAFETLGRTKGADLGGYRAKIYDDIDKAAKDVVAAIKAANDAFGRGRGR